MYIQRQSETFAYRLGANSREIEEEVRKTRRDSQEFSHSPQYLRDTEELARELERREQAGDIGPLDAYSVRSLNDAISVYNDLHRHGSVPEMSDEDKRALMKSIEETGGFTMRDHPGDAPSSGYMVSLPGYQEKMPRSQVSEENQADFLKRQWEKIHSRPDLYGGGWADKADFYDDISKHDPRLWDAVDDALEGDQLAIYDTGHGWDLGTEDNGEYNPLLDEQFAMVANRRRR